MGLSHTSGWSAGLIATADHVWGGDDAIEVTAAGQAPASWRAVERYRVAADFGRARFVLPATSRRAAAGSVRAYNQLRPSRTRAARAVLGAALSSGGAGLLRSRLDISADPAIGDGDLADHVLTRHLARELGDPGIVFAVGVHDQTPNSKPTLQAFSRNGTPVGFAKIGWNDVTRGQVQTEAAALRTLTGRLTALSTPTLRHAGAWHGRDVMVTAPMPKTVQPWIDVDQAPDADAITEVARAGTTNTTTLGASAQLARLRDAAATPGWDAGVRQAVIGVLDWLEGRFSDLPLTFGAWHGDWVPWNLARNGSDLVVWDWEQFREADVAIGSDTLHWHFQVAFVLRGEDLGTALRHARAMAAEQIAEVQGVAALDACHALYALELTARYEAMRVAGAGTTDRFHPQIAGELSALAAR